jgi:hypothetical protein
MFKTVKRKNTYKNTLSISNIYPQMTERISNEFSFSHMKQLNNA